MPRIRRKLDKTMEYEDAPSGYVTLYNYKEPFMKYEGGYGLKGVLLFDGRTGKVQCHLCGDWMEYLPNHLHKEHNMAASAYKEKVGLNQSSALLNEKQRAKLIENGLEARKKNLKPQKKVSEETKKKIRATLQKNVEEIKNLRGTCPAQLIDRLIKTYEKLGRTPTEKEFKGYDALIHTYGSMKKACKIARIPYRKPGVNINHPRKGKYKFTASQLIEILQNFKKIHRREPYHSDMRRGLIPRFKNFANHFETFNKAKEIAYGTSSGAC